MCELKYFHHSRMSCDLKASSRGWVLDWIRYISAKHTSAVYSLRQDISIPSYPFRLTRIICTLYFECWRIERWVFITTSFLYKTRDFVVQCAEVWSEQYWAQIQKKVRPRQVACAMKLTMERWGVMAMLWDRMYYYTYIYRVIQLRTVFVSQSSVSRLESSALCSSGTQTFLLVEH